jgi:RNA polymerase sigma factor (sigma-70 family)
MSTSTLSVGRAAAGASAPAVAAAPTIDFDELVREHRRQLLTSAYYRVYDWHDAEDAVQEALLQAWLKRDTIEVREDVPVVALVSVMAKNEASRIRAGVRRYVPSGDWVDEAAEQRADRSTDTGLPCMADPDTAAAAYAAIIPLPDRQRLAVQMRCLQGMDSRDVARCMGTTVAEVKVLVRAGVRTLTRRGNRHGAPEVEVPKAGPKALLQRDEEIVALFNRNRAVVEKLAPRQREAIQLCFYENLSQSSAAKRMGVASSAVKRYLLSAARHIRDAEVGKPRLSRIPGRPDLEALAADREFVASRPERQQRFVQLRLVEGLTGPKIAEAMGVSEQVVWGVQRHLVKAWGEWRATHVAPSQAVAR